MQYQSTATHAPFTAANQKEAVLIACNHLGTDLGAKVELVSCEHGGDHSACVVSVTTKAKNWSEGQQVEQEKTEQRRFVVKPYTY
ncbi:hypothetical protein HW115_01740 [Verrucomicrobiaceae bacterium N1E253]|uniref:Uncharacterized protein n=1 Tax=Oceaniferula marina TaxID=2748318 RepID=A0A851GA78_9BACT|nr:hypothetical protein [Oceaniferula marina]NWK54316.1 hypothetical protein [Oceaniferula marina]